MPRVNRACNIYMKRCQRTQYNEKYKMLSANVSTKQCEKYGMRMGNHRIAYVVAFHLKCRLSSAKVTKLV